ncbi:MAG TPA: S9 family peptidase [Rhizomicrobium sp.]|jgi:dipeptidyl aminopeptidase/acylaminoacyl peptidase
MRVVAIGASLLALTSGASGAQQPASQPKTVIHTYDHLALAASGRMADVEADDPGNLPEEAHGHVTVRDASGKILASYDPCKACKYSDTAFSPKGDALAFIATDEKAHKAMLMVAANGAPRTLASIDGVANTVRWSPDGSRLALLVTLGAKKKTGATEAAAPMTGEIGEENDEQRIAVIAAGGGALKPLSPADTYVYEFAWTPDGKGFVATEAKGNGDNNWWVAKLAQIDAGTGALRMIATPKTQIDLPRVSPDGRMVAFIGGLMSDWGSIGGDIYTVPLAGGTLKDITPNFKGTFRGLSWNGGKIRVAALIDDNSAALDVEPTTGATKILWQAPVSTKAQTFDGPIQFAGNSMATIVEDFTHAPTILAGRLPHVAPVAHENDALPANVAAQTVHWKSDKYFVQGWLFGPKTINKGKKYPLIMIVHGGPSAAAGPHYIAAGGQHGTNFDFAYDLVSRGYYIFYPNPRGSYGQGEAFTRANIKDFGRGDLRDDLKGIDEVEHIAPVDDHRLGMYGHSYGGWMAMWLNTQSHRFKAIVAGAGVANWTSYYGENGIDQWMIPFFGASVYDDPAVYRAASPIDFIKNAKTPTLIYVGERDVECPAPQSLEYWHALKAMGVETKLIIYAGEGHHFHKMTDLEDLRHRIIGWFDAHLK